MPRHGGERGPNMFYAYILQNSNTKRHYIGSTNDLDRRLQEHNRGQTRSTISNGVWVLAYYEIYNTKAEASKRERQIKSFKGGNAFKKLMRD